jgi:large subunit ribosomal protein L6
MSRIGKAIIDIPKEANVTNTGDHIVIKGPKGELRHAIPYGLTVTITDGKLEVVCKSSDKARQAIHGYYRAELANAVTGVTRGWTKVLELSGVGFRAAVTGVNLVLTIGFSHPVTVVPPAGITFSVNEGKIVVAGIDKQTVGQTAASIREIKKPEPYKGKGIKYEGEYIRKKAGKAKAVGGAPGAK